MAADQLFNALGRSERKEKLRQLFGDTYQDDLDKELSRVTKVEQPQRNKAEPQPEWMQPQSDGQRRFTLWLEAGGVSMEKVVLVPADDGRRTAVVTASDVPAGATLFDVPASLMLTAESAFADKAVGRDLRIIQTKSERTATDSSGFCTFAIAALLAAERVRRGAVKGRLRRQDGGLQVGLLNFDQDGARGEVLPEWRVEQQQDFQSNERFSPLISALPWPGSDDECVVEQERADAVEAGAKLIAQLVEPVARSAWMQATQRVGAAQSTSDEDVDCRAVEALLLAMQTQLEPPLPLGQPDGERAWGGSLAGYAGPAICPLSHLVLPPSDVDGATGGANSILGRPTSGSVDSAIRCVAAVDLPAGTLVVADLASASSPAIADILEEPVLRPQERVRVIGDGPLKGRVGRVITLRPKDRMPVVRLEGEGNELVVLPTRQLQPLVSRVV